MFNSESSRYWCCLGSSHITTGALAVGCVELIFLTLVAIIAIGDYIFYSISFWSFLLMLAITGIRFPAVALMLTTVHHRYSVSALLLPELLCQVASVLTAIGFIAYIGVVRYGRFAYAETEDKAEMQETVIQSSIRSQQCFSLFRYGFYMSFTDATNFSTTNECTKPTGASQFTFKFRTNCLKFESSECACSFTMSSTDCLKEVYL